MTAKEVEHWLIENDFIWEGVAVFKEPETWVHKKYPWIGILDSFVQKEPKQSKEWISERLAQHKATCN